MSCVLTIAGKNLDIDAFIQESNLSPYKKSYKGQPKFKSKPQGEKIKHSLLSILTSKAEFNDFDKQVKDTVSYLKRNRKKLGYISLIKGVDVAVLDFGVELMIERNVYPTNTFPVILLKLAAELNISIQLSIYPK